MFRRAKLTAVAFAIGAMVLGVTAAPAVATVSDDDSPLVMHFGDPLQLSDYVISADGTTAYAFGTKNMTIDLATRTATEVPGQLVDRLLYQGAKVAVGPYWASPGQDDYALVTLGTNQVEYFADTQDHWPILNHMVADESGNVTAVSFEGDFLRFDGSAIISEKRIRPNDTFMVGQSGLSADGMLYFEAYNSADQPEITTTVIVDMRTGNQLGTMHSDSTKPFVPVLFDASNESLWGTYQDGNYELVNYDWQSGTAAHPPVTLPFSFMGPISMYADGKSNWFVAGVSPVHAGEWTNPTTFGLRDVATGASKYYRVPSTGDLLYMDFYETTLGLIVGPKTSTPNSVNVEAIGQTVTFSAPAEGLAMSDPLDDGSDPEDTEGPTFGSVWQSSPDGVTWTDMEGADGPELTLTATEESITLQYRRHFFDRFWGEQNSAPAQMSTQKPKITRADDLPAVSAEKRFPAQTITASGQPDMTWSSSDLPAGLTINSSTGEITGTAPKAGEYQFTVAVTDAFGTDANLFHLKSTDTSVVPPVDPKPEPKPDPKPKPTPAPTPKPNELANTGINNWGAAGMAFALLALGAVGVLSSKRRTARLQH